MWCYFLLQGDIQKTLLTRVKHLWLLDLANDRLGSVSGNDLCVVEHVEFLCSISAGIKEDGLLSSGMVRKELRDKIL